MTKDEMINLIIKSPTINKTLDKVQPAELRDDFRQEFYLILLEKSEETLLKAYNKCPDGLIRYAGQIINNQVKSSTSPFYKKFRKTGHPNDYEKHLHTDAIEDDPDSPKIAAINYQNILLALNHIHPKKSKLFLEYYVNGKSYKQISKQYRINYITVYTSIATTKKHLQDILKYDLGEQ